MNLPLLTSRSRVMLFAPHPDDESLAAGVYLQRAGAAGAAVRVVYATDGERNCWPQRVLERKLRIGESDRRRWGARRQKEALAALQVLGIDPWEVEYLSLPDQGVTNRLLGGCDETFQRLANSIRSWQPTHLLMPSAADTHPDHSGLALLLQFVLDDFLPRGHTIAQLHYLVHGASASFAEASCELFGSPLEQKTKRHAIGCHATQVALSRRRFLGYANRPERFAIGNRPTMQGGEGPIRTYLRAPRELRLEVAFTPKPLRGQGATLHLLGQDAFGRLRRLRTSLPGRSSKIDLIDGATGRVASIGRYEGDGFNAEILLPFLGFDTRRPIFAKLDRRVWFFDEAGWMEIAPLTVETSVAPARELAVA